MVAHLEQWVHESWCRKLSNCGIGKVLPCEREFRKNHVWKIAENLSTLSDVMQMDTRCVWFTCKICVLPTPANKTTKKLFNSDLKTFRRWSNVPEAPRKATFSGPWCHDVSFSPEPSRVNRYAEWCEKHFFSIKSSISMAILLPHFSFTFTVSTNFMLFG